MNPREETDLDGDDRLIAAMRELCQVPAFSLGEEIARVTKQMQEERNGQE